VPEGTAWESVLRLVQGKLDSFAAAERSLLLGLIEDWARGVSYLRPYPEGSAAAAAIAHWLLHHFDNYRAEDHRQRTLRILAKIPNADRAGFIAILQATGDDRTRVRAARDLRKIIFEGVEGMQAARDIPEIIVSVANRYLLMSDAELQQEGGFGSDIDHELLFGIRPGRSHDYFPASAYRGPFLPLLRHHPRVGLDFIIAMFNHSAEWYAHPRVHSGFVERPFELTLTFADGTSRKQWASDLLWTFYRGCRGRPMFCDLS
jgi:hypothetical protein